MGASNNLTKMMFELEPDGWHGYETETLWAEPVGGRRYRLRNSPFFAFGVSVGDIVFGRVDDDILRFDGVSIRGGHSTYRLLLTDGRSERFERCWEPLQALGCTYEEGGVLSVDVLPRADIYQVYALLERGEQAGVWEFEEGDCQHALERRDSEG